MIPESVYIELLIVLKNSSKKLLKTNGWVIASHHTTVGGWHGIVRPFETPLGIVVEKRCQRRLRGGKMASKMTSVVESLVFGQNFARIWLYDSIDDSFWPIHLQVSIRRFYAWKIVQTNTQQTGVDIPTFCQSLNLKSGWMLLSPLPYFWPICFNLSPWLLKTWPASDPLLTILIPSSSSRVH